MISIPIISRTIHDVISSLQLCHLLSLQRYTKGLSSQQGALLAERCRQTPHERMRLIADVGVSFPSPQIIHCFYPLVLTLDHSLCGQSLNDNRYDKDPLLNACGVSIDKRMTKLTGRVLNCPVVTIYLLFCFLPSSIYTNLLVKIFTFKLLKLPQLKAGNMEDCIPRNGRWNFVHKVASCHYFMKYS